MDNNELKQSNIETLKKTLSLLENKQGRQALELLEYTTFVEEFDLMKKQIQAEILASLHENNRAECAYLAIIRQYPDNNDTKFALSQLYQNSGRFSQALEILNDVLELDSEHFMAWNNKGNILKQLKRHPEAIESYQQSLRVKPDYSIALTNLCLALSEDKQLDSALDTGLKALDKPLKSL